MGKKRVCENSIRRKEVRFLIILILCIFSAFMGASYSQKNPKEWKAIQQKTDNLKREMEDKVGLLGEQTESLHGKLKRCLDEKYRCCEK